MHETFVIKTDPEGKFVYTNIMISEKQNVLLNIYGAYFPSGDVKIWLFCFLNSCLSETRDRIYQQTTLVRKFVYIDQICAYFTNQFTLNI